MAAKQRRPKRPNLPLKKARADSRRKLAEAGMVVGVAWYKPEQWERLRQVSEDRAELEATHEERERTAEGLLRDMRQVGMYPEKVEIDVEDLLRWCQEHGRPVNAEARAEYTTESLLMKRR